MTKKKITTGNTAITYLVTGALPYANGDIHIGHLLEAVQTDIFVRFNKLRGHRVVYVCADDTHGTAIQINAIKRGISPQQLVAEMWDRHKKDYAGFSIGFDIFYTTDSPENRFYAEYIYKCLRDKGLIEEKEISQYYCEHDGRFLPDRFIKGTCPSCGAADQYGDVCEVCGSTYDPTDLKSPACVTCGKTPVLKSSRHVFVQLEKYHDFLLDFVRKDVLQPEISNFVQNWLASPLREWCISRDGPYFGFEIPGMKNKYFYVWLDAPIGYLASTKKWCDDHGENVDAFWGKKSDCRLVHFIGKDIVYFHTLFWPVMLDSSGFKLPSRIIVHGFLNAETGEKMSKSRGTFVLARDYLEKVQHPQAAEFLRFYFGSKLTNNAQDIDFNPGEFVNRVNTILSNNFGNLHHRTFVFCDRYFGSAIPDAPWDEALAAAVAREGAAIERDFDNAEYKSAIERLQALGTLGNKYFQDSKPWELIKSDTAAAAKVMVTCANLVRSLAVFLKPIVPACAAKVEAQFGATFTWQDHVFSLRKVKLGPTEKLVQPIEQETLDALFSNAAGTQKPKEATVESNAEIDIAAFKSVDLRVGVITKAERIEKSAKLVKLQVAMGQLTRQIVAGIAKSYTPESLVGKQVVIVANLKSATVMGCRSDGMLLAALDNETISIVQPDRPIASGSKVS